MDVKMDSKRILLIFVTLIPIVTCKLLITTPHQLKADATESICVTFDKPEENVNITISVSNLRRSGKEIVTFKHEHLSGTGHCLPITIPSSSFRHPANLKLKVVATSEKWNSDLNGEAFVSVMKWSVFVQTDKPIYKPGDTVKIRVLAADRNLKPYTGPISLVHIINPAGIKVAQWRNTKTEQGLGSFELPLSKDPKLGKWKIRLTVAQMAPVTRYFKVDEYVLPKYEVTVTPPDYVLASQNSTKVKVCAKYTYGKPVNGKVYVTFIPGNNLIVADTDSTGCSTITYNIPQKNVYNVQVKASVTEDVTGASINATRTKFEIHRDNYKIDLSTYTRNFYKPLLPFTVKGRISHPNGVPAPYTSVNLRIGNMTADILSKRGGMFSHTFPAMSSNEMKKFTVQARAGSDSAQSVPRYRRMRETRANLQVKKWYSPSESYVQIELLDGTLGCNTNEIISISFSSKSEVNDLFHYEIWSNRGIMVNKGSKAVEGDHSSNEIKSFTISVPVSPEMAPKSRLLVYTIRGTEVVADSTEISVESCFPNEATLEFKTKDGKVVRPGSQATINIKAHPGSLCSVLVADKSLELLGKDKGLTSERIFENLEHNHKVDEIPDKEWDYSSCIQPEPIPNDSNSTDPLHPFQPRQPRIVPRRRMKRTVYYGGGSGTSDYLDSGSAFKKSGVLVMTDLDVVNRPCNERDYHYNRRYFGHSNVQLGLPGMPGMMERGQIPLAAIHVEDSAFKVNNNMGMKKPNPPKKRSFFPETWLFQLKKISEDGIANIKEPVPDTITEWIGKALCTSTEAGIGLSPPASVVTFQPFFVSFNLPYSIIRGEVAPLVLSVFNYMKSCISVQLTLKESADFSIVGDSSVELCICSNEQKGHTYKIKPNRIGYIDLEVTAMPNTPEKAMCGNEIIVPEDSPADAVKRRLLVEPEGVEQEYTYSDLVCLSANSSFFTKTVGLELPSNYVADSARGYVSLIGDIMGPSLNGLDGLVRMPMGCGEQNMILFAPTIFVMQYLTNTRQLTDAIKTKSLGFMKVGYQRELNYRHNDGSFSAFGNSDGSGSMWLTAFVVKAFHQAKPFIFIDQADIDKTIKWITKNQDEEGCFPSIGRVIHKDMRGGLDRPNAKVGLTAFVLISLLEAGVPVDDASVQKALRCINVSEVPESDVYTTILIAYVHTLVNPTSESTEALMEKLVTMAKTDGETTHWEKVKVEPTAAPEKRKIVGDIIIDGDHHGGLGMTSPVDSKPLDVEMTAYALMALLNYKKTDSVPIALPIIRWLTTQRNAEGGFKSTQDTVVALQALAKYASFFSTSGTGSYVNVKTDKKENTFHVNADNKLILQKVEVNLPAQVAISANGTGCVLVQSNAKYNVPKDTLTVPAFVVTPSVAAVEHSPCEQQRMKICAKFEGSEPSSMAIVEVKMVSGWIPDKISVIEARKRNHLLKRVETKMNLVNFYFDEIPNEETCFSFTMEQLMKVDETKPGYVKVYDYYEPNLATTQPYSIQLGDKC